MSYAWRCGVCDDQPGWEIVRTGDVVVSWACNEHFAVECDRLQRDSEITELKVRHWAKLREHAEIRQTLRSVGQDEWGKA